MIKEYVLKKLLDASYQKARSILKESNSELLTPAERIGESIRYHLQSVENWSAEVSFSELNKPRHLTRVFIELDLFVYPRRIRQPGEVIESVPLRDIFDYGHRHPILLGQPGAGKTTSMKRLCQLLLHDENFHGDILSFPILIKLRELQKGGANEGASIIIAHLYDLLGLRISLPFPADTPKEEYLGESKKVKEKLVVSVLEELRVLLILDGFDEIAQKHYRDEALDDIRKLALHLNQSTMIVTSRGGDFVYSVDNTIQYEISPLKPEQIKTFAVKWLQDEERASDFLEKIAASPFGDTIRRPLTLAHLCAIYERVGKIPEKPKSIYKRIIHLLLEEWDQQRSVTRHSSYANFEVDRKFDFLSRLAYVLTTSFQATVFSEEDLRSAYYAIYSDYGLEAHEVHQVVSELETHTGLFLQAGYRQYEFAHKSLQEYLTAEFLVKLPRIPAPEVLLKLPNELAIAVTISSDAGEYFSELIMNTFKNIRLTKGYCRAFVSRLLLEKPDFSSSAGVSLSLVILYTMFVKGLLTEAGLAYTDAVITEFEALLRRVLGNNSTLPLANYYDVQRSYAQGGDNLLLIIKKRIFNSPHGNRVEKFPEELYVRESFFSRVREGSTQ